MPITRPPRPEGTVPPPPPAAYYDPNTLVPTQPPSPPEPEPMAPAPGEEGGPNVTPPAE